MEADFNSLYFSNPLWYFDKSELLVAIIRFEAHTFNYQYFKYHLLV